MIKCIQKWTVIGVFSLLIVSLSACDRASVKEEIYEVPSLEVVEEEVLEPRGETLEVDPYSYQQPLNIIDDNYRNFYEIFVYSFYDSDGDGIGDINGIRSKLDYINDGDASTDRDLGFNGLWLMPIMPATTYHKYDVTDYYAIDADYGTLEDFQGLIEDCHQRDISLIIDLVFNHTSAKHPWFLEATDYLKGLEEGEEPNLEDHPYVGYYHFTKAYDGGASYHQVGNTGWYYEGVFWDQMPDLALENPLVRKEVEAIAKYWLDMGVDGFRLDGAKEYYSGESGRNIDVLSWFHDYVISVNPEAYIVGEVWDSNSTISDYYESGVTSLFNFPLAMYSGEITMTARQLGTSSARTYGRAMVSSQDQFSDSNATFIDAPFVSNHDTTRISAQCVNNEDQMKMAAGLLLTWNGSPFVYYGEEVGMNSFGGKDENKRLPMHWSSDDLTGITKPPMAADAVEQKFDPVDRQLLDPYSLLNYYKRGVRLRNENPEIARGDVTFNEDLSSKEICVVEKVYNESKIVIVYNIDSEAIEISLKGTAYEGMAIRGYLTVDDSDLILKEGTLEMPKYAIVILK